MQKTKIICMLALVSIIYSCSVSKSARQQRNLLSGSWILNDVSYENNQGSFKSVIFGDAQDICFEGSDWFFRDNNSTGRYTIKQGSLCQGGDRFIRWSVVEPADRLSQLQFKFIDDKRKDVSGGRGYRLDIANLNEQTMTLKSNVSVDGQAVTIVYEFTRK
ncbi:lipocalin family protein [uncultured Croceitalea sp.]|uniref:lipocalin family protein n=1 Tax=uncultured Croceitalea sp. TaxID=1798908 RepID=UPI003305BABC